MLEPTNLTHTELLERIVNAIYATHGAKAFPLRYFLESQHPTEQACLKAAENIFEEFVGDSPDYSEIADGFSDA